MKEGVWVGEGGEIPPMGSDLDNGYEKPKGADRTESEAEPLPNNVTSIESGKVYRRIREYQGQEKPEQSVLDGNKFYWLIANTGHLVSENPEMMDPGSIDSYKEEITHYSFEQLVTKVNESNYEAIKENLSYYLALVEVVKEKRLDNGKVIMIDQRRTSD